QSAGMDPRLVIEKPFGHDRMSARQLDRIVKRFFPEEDIFRIDHYLGKEPVQNIIYTRFANSMFEPVWNRVHVHSFQGPRALGCRTAANSMMRPAPFATFFKTTCCNCWPT